jgi:hypothetical protein
MNIIDAYVIIPVNKKDDFLHNPHYYRTFLVWGFWIVASRFSVSMEAFSQGNPRRRSLQVPRSATSAGLPTQHLVLVFCLFISVVHFLITL